MNILFFHGSWCEPCKATAPHFEKAVENYPDLNFLPISMDSDWGMEKASEYNVRSVPTIVITDDTGEMVQCLRGAQTYDDIASAIEELM